MTNHSLDEMLHNHWQKKASVYLSGAHFPGLFQSRILGIAERSLTVANTVPPSLITQFLSAGPFTLIIGLARFSTAQVGSDGVNMTFNMDEMTPITDARQDARITFEANENVQLEITNPFDGETILRKPIIEMSSSGLSIKTEWESKLFTAGTEFTDLKVLLDSNLYQRADGKVIYKRPFFDLSRKMYFQVGIQLFIIPQAVRGQEESS